MQQLVPSFPDWMSGGYGINRVQELVTLKFMSLYLVELLSTRDHMMDSWLGIGME